MRELKCRNERVRSACGVVETGLPKLPTNLQGTKRPKTLATGERFCKCWVTLPVQGSAATKVAATKAKPRLREAATGRSSPIENPSFQRRCARRDARRWLEKRWAPGPLSTRPRAPKSAIAAFASGASASRRRGFVIVARDFQSPGDLAVTQSPSSDQNQLGDAPGWRGRSAWSGCRWVGATWPVQGVGGAELTAPGANSPGVRRIRHCLPYRLTGDLRGERFRRLNVWRRQGRGSVRRVRVIPEDF